MRHTDIPPTSIQLDIDGKVHSGRYLVSGKVLTVSSGGRQKSAQVGRTPPEDLAKTLLRGMVAPAGK